MNRKTTYIVLAVLVFLIIGMFAFTYMKRAELAKQQDQSQQQIEEQDQEEQDRYGVDRVDAKHFFVDGTHTIAGEIMMPTPCDLLETNAEVRESAPEQVQISFEVVNNSEGMCAQVLTPQRFKVSFDASEDARISADLMGQDVTLNLVEAEEGEDPEDFELFIKG